ncbi:hypothetical protein [Methylobacterium sp. J-090]|uniref:hypothetical protein n=1 Tax=Methylobacterium sp. J-090 TaxID=2836666 RepID=UPI001FB8DED4|nr:hypothetical protein [Methylobacterium sp. J-090]MCJ2080730.1 hypothetical protein [Methylobacterium sp. J-090]
MMAGATQGERPPKPSALPFTGLPDLPALRELQAQPQWLAWDYVWRAEKRKWDKPPLNARTGGAGSSTDRNTWATYECAAEYVERRSLAGVGYALTAEEERSGIDLDKCRDRETGVLQAWAQIVVDFAETYCEVSPSGEGLRLFVRGKLTVLKNDAAKIEIYPTGRYLTITGQHVLGTPQEIREAPRTIAYLRERALQFQEAEKAAAERVRELQRRKDERAAEARPVDDGGGDEAEGPSISERVAASARRPDAATNSATGSGSGKKFWREVNTRALANLASWVPSIFPRARVAAEGGYRVTSHDLGRDLEEDLSIHPSGIVDFGVHDMGDARDGKLTPIQLVIDHGGANNAADAALWLCERIGLDPTTLGWKGGGKERKARSGAPLRSREDRRKSGPKPSAEANGSHSSPDLDDAPHDPQDPDDEDTRPIVRVVNGKVPEATDRMEQILLGAGAEIFSRAGGLSRPVIDAVPAAKGRMTTVARMCPLTTVSLADMAARIMQFRKFDKRSEEWININPPIELTATLLAREGQWHVPGVAGVITTPMLRPDGSLLTTPGYDKATRLFLALDPDFSMPEVPEHPTRDDAEHALAELEQLLDGFPFVEDVDRAVALAGILTAAVRGVIPTAPLCAIRAHSPGTGKSYLVDLASVVATGRRCPVIAAGKTEEETEKRLGALLRDAVPVVSIDNVNGELGGDMLCQMTERPLVRVRILGKSEAPELECRSAVFATGNNLTLLGDMTRRAILCTLDARVERPELREFAFDPVARVLEDRGRYVAAIITIIRAYRSCGSPNVCGPIGSYEEWSSMVRAPLIWLGHVDPIRSMETAREEDPELSAIRELFGHWRAHLAGSKGFTTNAIIRVACEKRAGVQFDYGTQDFVAPEFRDLLLRQAGDGGAVNSRKLGKWLARVSGRIVDDFRLVVKIDGSNGNRFWLRGADVPVGQEQPLF